MGGARGALALTRADPGSPHRGEGRRTGPSLSPLPAVTQPRGRCPAPQPGAESVRRPRRPRPNQTSPHPRHYLTGELGGSRKEDVAPCMGRPGSRNPLRVFLSSLSPLCPEAGHCSEFSSWPHRTDDFSPEDRERVDIQPRFSFPSAVGVVVSRGKGTGGHARGTVERGLL